MSKITKQNVGGTDYTMVGCALTGVCASAADAFVKAVTLSDGDEISDGMTVIVTFANGNTAGTAPASKTIYSSDQVSYYEDSGLTVPFTLAPAGCYEITYTGTGNAYTYISYPVIQIGSIIGVLCDASGNTVSGSLWAKGAQIGILFKDGKFLLVSGALLNNMSALPTDAVLHYSFDDVPDYPDGTALYFRNKNFLSTDGWGGGSNTMTYPNGILTVASLTTQYVSKNFTSGNIVKAVIRVSADDTLSLYCGLDGTSTELQTISAKANVPIEVIASIPSGTLSYVGFHNLNLGLKFEILSFYIGDGSYVTPVIDNANGQNNGTNNGGLAVKGVSGKGIYLIAGKYISVSGSLNLQDKFSFSFWYNPSNATTGINGTIINSNMIAIRNGMSWNSTLTVVIFYSDNTNTPIYSINLPANTWQHIVCIKDGLQVSIYIDGVKVKSGTLENKALRTLGSTLSIGVLNCERNQSVDDLLVFDRALSETEVKALYLNRGNTPKYYDASDYWEKTQVFPVSSLTYVAEKTYEPVTEETDIIEAGQYNYLVLPYILATQVPAGYHVEYVCSWLGGTSGNNKIQVWVNNVYCGEKSTYTPDEKFLGAAYTRFKRSDIVLEPVLTYTNNGTNIKVKLIPGTTNGRAFLRSLSITAFLVKD